jgi:subtilisin family serine protease
MVPAAAGNLRPSNARIAPGVSNSNLLEVHTYIVQLADPPAVTYRGGKSGLAATQPGAGRKLEVDDPDVREYGRHLVRQHDATLRSVGAYYEKIYSYRYAFNGFAARMTELQAQKLRARRNVLNVWQDRMRYLHTNDSPGSLGLFDTNSGLRTGLGLRGDGVVIGVIDSGITPEHPSFGDRRERSKPRLCRSSWAENSLLGLWLCYRFRNPRYESTYSPPANWRGRCEAGETTADRFRSSDCNNKLIGARYYIDGFLENNPLDENEFISPRDADGHGTHIASTAAGIEVDANLAGNNVGRISGMAPRARIAAYKACWLEPGQTRGSCSTADLQRAIEDAVADGVDIINYSVGNTDISISDPDDLALLAAAEAGVLSVVAAGNDGPTPGTILSPAGAPWVLTVGAATRQGTQFQEALKVDAPVNVAGRYVQREATFTPPLRDEGRITASLVLVDDGVSIIGQGAFGTTFDACEPIVNEDEVSGRIAFIQRGTCDFVVKLQNAEAAGAIAAVVFDTQAEPITMAGPRNVVGIPAVAIGAADGQLLKTELDAGETVEVTLDKDEILNIDQPGDVLGSFSSRGPNPTAPDILKPDVIAPGVDILAGQTPDVANGIRGEKFQYLSGTSMAVPHVAGLAALIKQRHPDWSPAAIASALITTARQDLLREDGETPADPFDMGGGHVVPNRAIDPGLIYEARAPDFDAFLCGTGVERVGADCEALSAAGFPDDAPELNIPSIALSGLVNGRSVTRRVTNVGDAGSYEVTVEPPTGVNVTVTPSVLNLSRGESAEYTVEFEPTGSDLYDWQFGALNWDDGSHQVRSPIAVRPVPFLAPLEVFAQGLSGQTSFPVEFGYTGEYSVTVHGLAPADVAGGSVADDPTRNYDIEDFDNCQDQRLATGDPDLPCSVARFEFQVAPNAAYLRVALFNEDTDGEDDLDFYLYSCDPGPINCFLVGTGGNADSNEQFDLLFPFPGSYVVDVHGFRTDETAGGPGANFDLSVWVLGNVDDRGNLAVSVPPSATAGQTGQVELLWNGLPSARYLGGITHDDNEPDEDPLEFTVITLTP